MAALVHFPARRKSRIAGFESEEPRAGRPESTGGQDWVQPRLVVPRRSPAQPAERREETHFARPVSQPTTWRRGLISLQNSCCRSNSSNLALSRQDSPIRRVIRNHTTKRGPSFLLNRRGPERFDALTWSQDAEASPVSNKVTECLISLTSSQAHP
jgi:hypothetical protein